MHHHLSLALEPLTLVKCGTRVLVSRYPLALSVMKSDMWTNVAGIILRIGNPLYGKYESGLPSNTTAILNRKVPEKTEISYQEPNSCALRVTPPRYEKENQ